MTDLAALEARITALEDIEAIKKLKARYFFSCDQKDVAAVTDCFAEGEVEIKYGRIGDFSRREDLVRVFNDLACHDHIVEMHHAQNPQIDLLGPTSAKAIWGLYYYMINTRDNTATQLGGFYKDEYVKTRGQWKINKTEYVLVSTQLLDLSEGVARVLFAGRAAPAEIDDPSSQA